MQNAVHGIHHVTVIAGDAQENLNFYAGVMGMRLVKKSVNQDAPDTYHLFYADAVATPGTDLTFFPWPALAPARLGRGLAVEVALSIPVGGLVYWQQRLTAHGIAPEAIETRFGETVLPFSDPHGLCLALVETKEERPFVPWTKSAVPSEFQVRGMHSVRLCERALEPTASLLTRLGFTPVAEENGWHRYGVAGGSSGKLVEVQAAPGAQRGEWGTGGVHHVAWRTSDATHEMALRADLARVGIRPTELIDRFWFESVYFREPGGVLFELATDGPGFGVDEDMEHLGEKLVLPPWLEAQRAAIEAALPVLNSPHQSVGKL